MITVMGARDVARGLVYLHERNVTHRDLKSRTCSSTSRREREIGDLASADAIPARGHRGDGELPLDGPEVIRHEPYNPSADVYSFTMIAYEAIALTTPRRRPPVRGARRGAPWRAPAAPAAAAGRVDHRARVSQDAAARPGARDGVRRGHLAGRGGVGDVRAARGRRDTASAESELAPLVEPANNRLRRVGLGAEADERVGHGSGARRAEVLRERDGQVLLHGLEHGEGRRAHWSARARADHTCGAAATNSQQKTAPGRSVRARSSQTASSEGAGAVLPRDGERCVARASTAR